MGSGSEIFYMIFFIFILIVFLNSQLLMPDAAKNSQENGGLKELNSDARETQIKRVSGVDENEEMKGLIIEKFRILIGITPSNGVVEYGLLPSPSPSPTIEAEAPAPVPVLPIHIHSRRRSPRPSPVPPAHEMGRRKGDKARARRILMAVVASTGATSVICVLGLILMCRKFLRGRRRRSARSTSVCSMDRGSRGGSKCVNSSNSANKVSFEPGPDLFYLDSLREEIMNIPSNQNQLNSPLHEGGESREETKKSESDNVSCSLAKEEILSDHEEVELMKCESSDKMLLPLESYSSNDESFHSFCDSHSPTVRLSNASDCSLSDPTEVPSPKFSETSPPRFSKTSPLHSPSDPKQSTLTFPLSSNSLQDFPPPPPPPPHVHTFPSRSSSRSTQITSNSSCSSSGSNQTPEINFPSSPPHPLAIPLGRTRSVPPPPCPPTPPPFPKARSNSLKPPPPPPPSHLPQFTPLGKDGAPLPKLKPLHWDKVRAAPDRSMVWDKLRSSSFELDEEMIESLFGYNMQSSMKNDEGKSKSPSPSKHILEPKRLQNITILSKALNATADQVCAALVQGDGLRIQQLEALIKMVLTKEEEAKLSNYKGDINELGLAEKFAKEMLDVPFAFPRIEAMLYRDTFEDEAVHLRKSFAMLEEACKELGSSRLFLKLLEAVLRTGNRMNVGTIRGGARAFKLDALLKLSDVKGTDGKTTLLHFVVQEMIRSEGVKESEIIIEKHSQKIKTETVDEMVEVYRRMGLDLVSQLSIELCNVKKTATIDLDVLLRSVSNLSDGMAKLHHLVHKDLCLDEQSKNFVISMKSFLDFAAKSIKELQEDENRVLLHVKEITEYFHGNVSKDEANPLRIFVIVRDFMGMLDQVCKELRSLKIPSAPNPVAPFR